MKNTPKRFRFDPEAFVYAATHAGYTRKGKLHYRRIAEESGVGKEVIRRYANGMVKDPVVLCLAPLADIFGCDIEDFLEDTEED